MVVLFGYNYNSLLEKRTLSISEYYDSENPLIEDDKYRMRKGINKIKGTIYDDDSNDIVQLFVNRYDIKGRLVVSNAYNADLFLIDTCEIFYDYNQYIGYCEINITMQNNKLNAEITLVPQKSHEYFITMNLMESHNDEFVLADKNITTRISDKFFKVCSDFDTKPTEKYRVDVGIEVYDCGMLLDKSEIVSNVLAESFNNAFAKDKE